MQDTSLDAAVRAYGAVRTSVGAALLAAPRLLVRLDPSSTPALARLLGVRDVLVGALTLRSSSGSRWRRLALVAGATADAADGLLYARRLRRTRRGGTLLVVVSAAGGTATGAVLAWASARRTR